MGSFAYCIVAFYIGFGFVNGEMVEDGLLLILLLDHARDDHESRLIGSGKGVCVCVCVAME